MLKTIFIFIFAFILSFIVIFHEKTYDGDTIYIGTSLPKTNIMGQVGNSLEKGALSYIRYANENNLLNGKKIELISYDDKYEPKLTLQNIKKLIYEDEVFTLFGIVGTPTVKNILPLLNEVHIPLFATFSGAAFLRDEDRNYINFRSSYAEEIEQTVKYLYEKKGVKKFAVFYQNDDYGEEGYIALINSLEKRDLKLYAEGNYKRNTLSIKHAFHEIKDKKPEAIIMVGAYRANALFIQKAKENKNFKDTFFCNLSFSDPDSVIKELNKQNVDLTNIIFSEVVPSYIDSTIPITKEYQSMMDKYFPEEKFSFISFEAYLASKILVNALTRVNGTLTRKKFIQAIEYTPKNLLDGLTLKYKNTQLLNKVYLFKYEDLDFKEIKF